MSTLSVVTDAHTPVEHEIRRIMALHGVRHRTVHARSHAGTALLVFEQIGASPSQAARMLDDVKALEAVRNATLDAQP